MVLAVMATRAREDSEIDPLEDEIEFIKSMKIAGFKKQFNFQMPLLVPAEEFLVGTLSFVVEASKLCFFHVYTSGQRTSSSGTSS